MTAVLAAGGWITATLLALMALLHWRAESRRMEVIARACHELRAPLTAARLGLHLCTRAGELSGQRLQAIELELRRASLALEDLAGVRSTGPRARGSDEVDLVQLLAESVEASRPGASASAVELRMLWIDGPSRVLGDRLRLAQALANLIANAIEHGGGVVEIRGRGDLNGVRIEVTDRGPGLPAPVAELARRPRRGRGARGRGLAIASEVARAHGGRVAAAPATVGARLVLELPAAPTHSSTAPAPRLHPSV